MFRAQGYRGAHGCLSSDVSFEPKTEVFAGQCCMPICLVGFGDFRQLHVIVFIPHLCNEPLGHVMRIGADVEPYKGSSQVDTVTLPATVCKDWMIKGATSNVLTTVTANGKPHTDNKEHTTEVTCNCSLCLVCLRCMPKRAKGSSVKCNLILSEPKK